MIKIDIPISFTPEISVIMPVYNTPNDLLERSIQSVLNQTYREIEMIIIDDGSNNECKKFVEKYEIIDERVRVISIENSGVSYARNVGIKKSVGKLLAFIDSDDYYEEEMLEEMVEKLKDLNADISICSYFIETEKRKMKVDLINKKKVFDSEELFQSIMLDNTKGFLCNKLFRRELFEDIKLPEDMDICEDLFVISKILKTFSIKAVYTEKALYHYCMRGESATNNFENLITFDDKWKYVEAITKIGKIWGEKNEIIVESRLQAGCNAICLLYKKKKKYYKLYKGIRKQVEKDLDCIRLFKNQKKIFLFKYMLVLYTPRGYLTCVAFKSGVKKILHEKVSYRR